VSRRLSQLRRAHPSSEACGSSLNFPKNCLAYDGVKLWATIYLGRGIFATFDPAKDAWEISNGLQSLREEFGAFRLPAARKIWR